MKSIYYITAVIAIASVCSCTDDTDDSFINVSVSEMQETTSSENHFVHLSDVQTLTKTQQRSTRAVDQQANIVCYTDAEQDTLLYICDKGDEGWTIYSSDTRVPAIVAESSEGNFAKASENEALMAWISTIAEDMKVIRHTSDRGLNFTEEEIATNKEFWESINNVEKFIKSKKASPKRRSPHDPLTPIDNYRLYGHYELQGVYNYERVYDSIPRLTKTDWDQESPFNAFCPQKTSGYGNALAGCAPIAVAQILFFLHFHLGVPLTAPSEAFCNGNVDNYTAYQGNYTSNIWYMMDSVSHNRFYGYYAAPLIANVGMLLNVHYGNNGSSVLTSNLANAFPAYGISCDFTGYNENGIKSNLSNGMPVLLSATSNSAGHAFIADRYKRKQMVRQTIYRWVYDENPVMPDGTLMFLPCISDSIIYDYYSPYISMIGMNWGWGIDFNDYSEWFTLTGDWICNRYNQYNWNENRRMIYNFSISN